MRSSVRFGLAAGAVLTLLVPVGSMAYASTASAAAARTITKISCFNTEDWSGDDEVYIRYKGGTNLWGPHNMNEGDTEEPNVRVYDGRRIQLWDEDSPDGDDLIGEVRIRSGKNSYRVEGNGASYALRIN